MLLKTKRKLIDLLNMVTEILKSANKIDEKETIVSDCLTAIDLIIGLLEEEQEKPEKSLAKLKLFRKSLTDINDVDELANKQQIMKLTREIRQGKNILNTEIDPEINVVFLPYKITMWDSLDSIYKTALRDKKCNVKVVPIPYYELSNNEKTFKYEGNRFPSSVPITHYSEYSLAEEEPDIIFVHNIYDQYNTITQVHEDYFTDKLKQFTNMLVYVPYHISSFVQTNTSKYLAYNIPSIMNVDKVILAGEHVKKAAIRDGVPQEKLLVLGSPKFDNVVNKFKEGENVYPKEWKEKIDNKTVITLNTGCMYFAEDPYFKVDQLARILSIPDFVDDTVLIWRPHPLTRISIEKYNPHLLEYYDVLTKEYISNELLYKNIIFDELDDYMSCLVAADILISSDGSLFRAYMASKKKAVYVHRKISKNKIDLKENLIFSDGLYYFYNENESWTEMIKKLIKGYDPLEKKREKLVERAYVNVDGTCGEKVYQSITVCFR